MRLTSARKCQADCIISETCQLKRINVDTTRATDKLIVVSKMFVVTSHHHSKRHIDADHSNSIAHLQTQLFVCIHKLCVCVLLFFLLCREAKVCHLFNRFSMKVSGSKETKSVCTRARVYLHFSLITCAHFKSNTHSVDHSFSVFSFISIDKSNGEERKNDRTRR